ncbi:MAG: glycosyltransferase family 2 protein [Chloroflexi bacterium]|nr:glycosyltransferase family 2 protein [Chloroflexota bacterium]
MSHNAGAGQPDISVITVNRNTREFLAPLFHSIMETAGGLLLELIMVDNGSADGSVEFVRQEFPSVRIIENGANLGFAAANNRAIRESNSRYILLVNTDVVVLPGALETMREFLELHPDVGVVGCKVLNPDGSLQLSGKTFPDPVAAFYIGLGIHRILPDSKITDRYYLPVQSYESRQEVDHVSGSCMMVNRAATGRVGLFDENFFLYCEDVDWCTRIRAAGFKIFYLPEAQIIHYKGGSSAKESTRMIREYHRSAWYFYKKHYAGASSTLLTAVMFIGIHARKYWLLLRNAASSRKGVKY